AIAFHQWNSQQHVLSLDDIQVILEPNPSLKEPLKKTLVRKPIFNKLLLKKPLVKVVRKETSGVKALIKSASYFGIEWRSPIMKKESKRIRHVHRTSTSLKSRWHNMSSDTQKFVASNRRGSGKNEVDVIRSAHAFFCLNYDVDFIWEHVWHELQHESKWCTWLAREGGGRFK
ncbi:hypothetical protein V2J09_017675, partial [Rumex salicifolius]